MVLLMHIYTETGAQNMLEHEISWLTVTRSWNGNNRCDYSDLIKALMLFAFVFDAPRNRRASVFC